MFYMLAIVSDKESAKQIFPTASENEEGERT